MATYGVPKAGAKQYWIVSDTYLSNSNLYPPKSSVSYPTTYLKKGDIVWGVPFTFSSWGVPHGSGILVTLIHGNVPVNYDLPLKSVKEYQAKPDAQVSTAPTAQAISSIRPRAYNDEGPKSYSPSGIADWYKSNTFSAFDYIGLISGAGIGYYIAHKKGWGYGITALLVFLGGALGWVSGNLTHGVLLKAQLGSVPAPKPMTKAEVLAPMPVGKQNAIGDPGIPIGMQRVFVLRRTDPLIKVSSWAGEPAGRPFVS